MAQGDWESAASGHAAAQRRNTAAPMAWAGFRTTPVLFQHAQWLASTPFLHRCACGGRQLLRVLPVAAVGSARRLFPLPHCQHEEDDGGGVGEVLRLDVRADSHGQVPGIDKTGCPR